MREWTSDIGYEKIAQRAIKLLMAKIHDEFGLRVICGAELEYLVAKYSFKSPLSIHNTGRIDDYRPYKDKIAFNSGVFPSTGSRYLDSSSYISHSYYDGINIETIFTHLGKTANPLRLAGAIETFKTKILSDSSLAGSNDVKLQPYDSPMHIRSMHLNFSLVSVIDGKNMTRFDREFANLMFQTLQEVFYFGVNNSNAAQRLQSKIYLGPNNNSIKVKNVFKPRRCSTYLHCDYLSPDSNAYLGIVGLLASIYNSLSEEIEQSQDQSIDRLQFPSNVSYYFKDNPSIIAEHFRDNLQNSALFRTCLNNLSNEQLGDKLISACLREKDLTSPKLDELARGK